MWRLILFFSSFLFSSSPSFSKSYLIAWKRPYSSSESNEAEILSSTVNFGFSFFGAAAFAAFGAAAFGPAAFGAAAFGAAAFGAAVFAAAAFAAFFL